MILRLPIRYILPSPGLDLYLHKSDYPNVRINKKEFNIVTCLGALTSDTVCVSDLQAVSYR